ASGHALVLALRHVLRVADDAALRTAVGNVDHGTLPRHPCRERPDLVQRHLRVVADPALAGPAGHVVLDPVAGEHFVIPIVHADREVDRQLPLRVLEDLAHPAVETEDVGYNVDLLLCCLKRIDVRAAVHHNPKPPGNRPILIPAT